MVQLRVGADGLDRDVEGAVEAGRVGWGDDLVLLGPDRDPHRPGRHRARVELGEQVAVRGQFGARGRALAGQQRPGQRGDVGAVVRRAEGDDAAGDVGAAVLLGPEPRHHPAGRIADHVHRRRSAGDRRPGRPVQHRGLVAQLAGAVAGQPDHRRLPPGRPQPGSQHVQRRGRPAVAGHQQHRPRPVLPHRSGRRGRPRPVHHDQDRRGQHARDEHRQDPEQEPAAYGRQRGQHHTILRPARSAGRELSYPATTVAPWHSTSSS